ncbi:hypothetical protein DH2020_023643 [Rehmannia glutinosa]|uniref:Uncharacterized protein n=1 Tax=Rehmannia glutinosa TaxID=99300 RepID=A0ABR0WAY8_REHGL
MNSRGNSRTFCVLRSVGKSVHVPYRGTRPAHQKRQHVARRLRRLPGGRPVQDHPPLLHHIPPCGHKPCVQTFAADQFDEGLPEEKAAKSSFFNWWYVGIVFGATAAVLVVIYVEDYVGWKFGFGMLAVAVAAALDVSPVGSPFTRVAQVVVAAVRKRRLAEGICVEHESVEEGKLQPKPQAFYMLIQRTTMTRSITPKLQIAAASFQVFTGLTILTSVLIYEKAFIPIARAVSGNPSGITILQQIGTGLFLSILTMAVAALVESKWVRVARENGLLEEPKKTVAMAVYWLIPQYILCGISDVFTVVGLQELFYDQMPGGMRSIGAAAYISVVGIGSFLSSGLIAIVQGISSRAGNEWLGDNINRANLEGFYWVGWFECCQFVCLCFCCKRVCL